MFLNGIGIYEGENYLEEEDLAPGAQDVKAKEIVIKLKRHKQHTTLTDEELISKFANPQTKRFNRLCKKLRHLMNTELNLFNQIKSHEGTLTYRPDFGILEIMEQLNTFFRTHKSVNRVSDSIDSRIRLKMVLQMLIDNLFR